MTTKKRIRILRQPKTSPAQAADIITGEEPSPARVMRQKLQTLSADATPTAEVDTPRYHYQMALIFLGRIADATDEELEEVEASLKIIADEAEPLKDMIQEIREG